MINDKIKQLKERWNMTQDDLANQLFVSRTLVTKWENGSRLPSRANARKIAELFQISYEELTEGSGLAIETQEELAETIEKTTNQTDQFENIDGITSKVNAFLRTLSKRDRMIFLRRYYFFDSTLKIAKLFKMSEEETGAQLEKLREKMLEYIENEE